jgi:hypothetical protein
MKIYKDKNGIIRFFDGSVVYIVEIQYSHDGIHDWEGTYNPYKHAVETSAKIVEGHKYMRVRHAGDEGYQRPMYINAVDGRNPAMRINNGLIQWQLENSGDDAWITLLDTTELKGEKGDQGVQGRGLAVDKVCYYANFAFATPSLHSVESCNRCNSTSGSFITVLSLGDGKHKIVQADIDNGKYRSVDGEVWVELGVNEIGRYYRFIAEDALGTNYIDYETTNTEFSSRGKVYAYDGVRWTELSDLAVPNYMVAAHSSDPTLGKFMEGYESDTIELDPDDKLIVKDNSIDLDQIKDSVIGYGLKESSGAIEVDSSDIAGFGLTSFIADSNSKEKLAVDTTNLVSDGLSQDSATDEDGFEAMPIKVNVDDFIGLGLESVTGNDTYKDIKVKQGDAILVDADGVNVKSDETSLESDGRATIRVTPTDNNSKGIQALHVHKNVANEGKGLKKGAATTDALEVKVEGSSIGFDGTGQLYVPDDGIEGKHLNSNVANESKGLHVTSNKLEVKLKTAGGISVDSQGLYLTATTPADLEVGQISDFEASVQSLIDASLATYVKHFDVFNSGKVKVDPVHGLIYRAENGSTWYKITVREPGDIDVAEVTPTLP